MSVSREEIVAMAVAAIAEETDEKIENLRIIAFREVPKCNLKQFVADHEIYSKKTNREIT